MLSQSRNDPVVICRGGELIVDGGYLWGDRTWRLSNTILTNMEWSQGRTIEHVYDGMVPVGAVLFDPSWDITMRFHGCGNLMAEADRKAMLRRLCDGVSVRELLGVVNEKLGER